MKKGNNRKLIIIGVLLIAAVALVLSGVPKKMLSMAHRSLLARGIITPNQVDVPAEESNEKEIADFSLELRDTHGNLVSLSDYKGKVIFINVWASWCPPCIAEMPGIDALHKKLTGNDVEMLMVSVDKDFERAKEFVERKGYGFNIYTVEGELPGFYEAKTLPTTFVIDADGNLAYKTRKMYDYNSEEFLDFLLSLR
ncbi:TlpA family protein disulfide reductase [Zeaxanthinibacter enoshimensis]|uniref:TlpA family protein disulfide reductase n=1 Tax=Zeaxanthinibacter enoshimensis TaxID=392009 RepID=UPI00356866A8